MFLIENNLMKGTNGLVRASNDMLWVKHYLREVMRIVSV